MQTRAELTAVPYDGYFPHVIDRRLPIQIPALPILGRGTGTLLLVIDIIPTGRGMNGKAVEQLTKSALAGVFIAEGRRRRRRG